MRKLALDESNLSSVSDADREIPSLRSNNAEFPALFDPRVGISGYASEAND